MFTRYLTQVATYREFLNKKDNFGSPMYGPIEKIKCRKFKEEVYVRDTDTSDLSQVTTYITEKKIKPKDLLDDKIVKNSIDMYDIRGNYSHTESSTE